MMSDHFALFYSNSQSFFEIGIHLRKPKLAKDTAMKTSYWLLLIFKNFLFHNVILW